MIRVSLALALSAIAIGAAAGADRPTAPQGSHGVQAAASQGKDLSPAKECVLDLGGGVKLEMVLIPAGEFLMGSPDSDRQAQSNEKPQHRVRITKPFYMGKYKVTQDQWDALMGSNSSAFRGPKYPVNAVSWDNCQAFIKKLNDKFRPQGGKFHLPTEAQWEYACRAGSTTQWSFGDDVSKLGDYAWYQGNAEEAIHPLGLKKPNAWGLYDIHGDLWEWCADTYDRRYYSVSPTDDPVGPSTAGYRVLRGGSWNVGPEYARSARRSWLGPDVGSFLHGFRLAMSL
jgi:formylglycine-generating enzyme required for sulfatase activity